MKRLLIFTIFLLLLAGCSSGHKNGVEFLKRQVTVGQNTYGYRVYVPKDRQPDQKLPVMLYLHGSGSRGDDNETQVVGFNKFIGENPQNYSFIIVFPQCRLGKFWAGEMTEQAIKALDETVKEFDGDPSRLYLAGFSAGAYGTWQTALNYPKKFAALVPIAGGIAPLGELSPEDRAVLSPKIDALSRSANPYAEVAMNLRTTPVWVFHGEKDEAVPVGESRKIVEELRRIGNQANYTEYEGMGHYSVEAAFSEPKLFEWLATQRLSETR
jgi:predicted peptidase